VALAFLAYAAVRPAAAGSLRQDTPEMLAFVAAQIRAAQATGDARADIDPATAAARAAGPAPPRRLADLTDREREVVALVGAGLSNDEIAVRLVVSPATAKTHVSRAMVKLGARDRAQLVVFAYEAGLVRPGWLP
jgi:DNA-binding NarL/FixJ family response regulator